MNSEDRRLRLEERPGRRIAVVWLVLCVIFLGAGMQRLLQGQFPDPDDALRLVQVRDLLAGQGWFDLHQYRIDAPAGTLMHWSRLVDIPLALVITIFTPLVGSANAESIALVFVPLITLGLILLVIGRLAWRLFDLDVAGFACLSVGLMAPLVFQLQPMRIDHHGWQIFTVALALWASAHRSPFIGGGVAGLSMAAGLTISLEILPMVAAFGGVLALRWFRDAKARWWLVSYMQALALGSVAAFFATRGIADLAQHCDAVSPAHLGFFVITAVGSGVIAAVPALPRVALIAAFMALGAAGILFFGLSSPGCLMTPFGALDPVVRDFWYINVSEGRPLWEQELATALPTLLQLLAALFATGAILNASRDWLREWWTDYALLFGASILLSLFVWRSASFAAVIAAIPLGWLAAQLLHRFRTSRRASGKLIAVLVLVAVLLPAIPFKLWGMATAEAAEDGQQLVRESSCEIRDSAVRLGALSSGTVFAPLDIGPSILLKSDHAVIATGHHRAESAMRDVIVAFSGEASGARELMQKHDADYVAMCTDLAEVNFYADANPDGLAAKLVSDEAPAWLEPVHMDAPAEFRVWRVLK